MKICLSLSLRRALLSAIAAVPSLTALVALSPLSSEARIWTYADPTNEGKYSGSIIDKTFKDEDVASNTGNHYFRAGMEGGAAISLVYFVTFMEIEGEDTLTHISYRYDLFDEVNLHNNTFTSKGVSAAGGGALLLSGSIIGLEDRSTTGQKLGIHNGQFTSNKLTSEYTTDGTILYGGALAIIENFHTLAHAGSTVLHGGPLATHIHEIKDTIFSGNQVVTYSGGYGGAIALTDLSSSNLFTPTIKNGITGGSFSNNSVVDSLLSTGEYGLGGGAIFIKGGDVKTIHSNFTSNHVNSWRDVAVQGGAISIWEDDKTKIESIGIAAHQFGETLYISHSQFLGNYAFALQGLALGGAISIGAISDELLHVGGNFSTNTALGKTYAAGGAINLRHSPQESISGNFTSNQVVSQDKGYGGAIYLSTGSAPEDKGTLVNIIASFRGNSVSHKGVINESTYTFNELSTGAGGALYIKNQDITGYLVTKMSLNYISANMGHGGALYLEDSSIGHIFQYQDDSDYNGIITATEVREYDASLLSIFDTNYIIAKDFAAGGALYAASSSIGTLSGDIKGNYALTSGTESFALGGAFFLNSSSIDDITAEISGNKIVSGLMARGGAISLHNESIIDNITGNIVNNIIDLQTFKGIDGEGAAIYNENSEVHISNYRSDIEISGNYILEADGTKRYEAIYNTATAADKAAVITFDTAIKNPDLTDNDLTNDELRFDIRLDDAITGSKEFVDQQHVYINPNDNGYGTGKFYLGNTISNQTVHLHYGVIDMVDSKSDVGAHGELKNVHLILNGNNASFDLSHNNLDSDSRVTVTNGVLNISTSTVQLQSIKNDKIIVQTDDVRLDTFLTSSSKDKDEVGTWIIRTPGANGDPSIDQAHRLTITEGTMLSTGSDGSTTLGAQKFQMTHDFTVSKQNLSQVTFESAAEFKALVDNESIFFLLDITNFHADHLPTDHVSLSEYWRWTFVSWDGEGGLSESDLPYISTSLLSLSLPDEVPLTDKYYLVLQDNSLTITNSSRAQKSEDAEYSFIEKGFFADHSASEIKLSSFDASTGNFGGEDRLVFFEDALGDNLYETGPDAVYREVAWAIDENGMLYMKVADEGENISIDPIYAYGLGGTGRPTSNEITESYVADKVVGNLFSNSSRDISYMDSDFVANTTNSVILYNGAKIQRLDSDFVGNTVEILFTGEINDGALHNQSEMGTINGDFITNRIILLKNDGTGKQLYGGAISNRGSIDVINGDFVSNYAASYALFSKGGALSNDGDSASIKTLNSSFYNNFASSTMIAHGGAIYDNGSKSISQINGYFDGNYALATISNMEADLHAAGGAIFRKDALGESNYTADFIANYAKAESSGTETIEIVFNAAGGAIYNEGGTGAIKSIKGNFYGNYVMAHNAEGPTISSKLGLTAKGGAIANIGAQIGNISGNFFANYTEVFIENTISQSGLISYGGAIYNDDGGTIGLLAQDNSITFEGNRTIKRNTFNLQMPDGEIVPQGFTTVEFNAIYNGVNSTVHFNSYGAHKITVNDGINGFGLNNVLEINSGIDGAGAGIDAGGKAFSLVEFNNKVSGQTINVRGGTLQFGSYTGRTFTMSDGSSFETEDSMGLLSASDLNIYKGARVEAKGDNLGSGNAIVVEQGTLALDGGTLSSKVQLKGGTMEISDTLTLSDSTIIRSIEGSGASHITGLSSKRAMTPNTLTSGSVVVEADSSLTLSHLSLHSIGIDGTAGDGLTLDAVVFDCSNVNMTMKAGDQAILRNSTLTGLTISAKENIDNPTGGIFDQPMAVYNLTELDLFDIVDVEGTLTFNLGNLHEFNKDEFTAFRLTGVSDIGIWHGNAYVLINGISYQIQGATNNGIGGVSDLYLYIPEPSTATLSLLALAGLLLRRRRKAA